METIAISKFKATCLAVLEQVRTSRQPVLVTRRGVPMAEIAPPPLPREAGELQGSWVGRMRIVGDIVAPAVDESEIEALRD